MPRDSAPVRTCVGCRQRRPQRELVRCVLTPDGHPVVSRTAAGRGAWLCAPSGPCFELAVRRRAFDRAWKRPVSSEVLDELGRILEDGPRAGEAKLSPIEAMRKVE
jgi:predicted RNA-binding protein YlxR (DUF448 family)